MGMCLLWEEAAGDIEVTNPLRELIETGIQLINEEWSGTAPDSEGNLWISAARKFLEALPPRTGGL